MMQGALERFNWLRDFAASSLRASAFVLVVAIPIEDAAAFDLQGHRGARGLSPENTLAAFDVAIAIGVTTLETDLAMTRDGVLVLSHDPHLNPALTRDAAGRWIAAPGPAILTLSVQELAAYDVGRLNPGLPYAAQWPLQVPADGERVPSLAQLFARARDARTSGGRPIRFNIETKITPTSSGEAASPEAFARAVVAAVDSHRMADRVTVQSFDWRSLIALKRISPALATACLTIESESMNTVRVDESGASPWHAGLRSVDHGGSIARLAKAAGCSTWSPFWRNVTPAVVAEAHTLGLRVVPWTVNNEVDLVRVIKLGVDGVITDYPDRARRLLDARRIAID